MFLSTGRRGLTFGDLAQHYAEHELVDCSESIRPKAHTTIRGYERVLRNRLLPRWGNRIAVGIEPLEVEQWLRSLKKEGDLANPTLGKTRRVNPPKRQPAACRQYACRAIHSGTAPGPFSTAPGHGCMKSLTHTPHCRLAAERLARSVSPLPPDIFFLSPPRLTSAIDSSLHRCADSSSTGLDDSRELLHPSLAPFNLHKSRVRRASGFLLTAFSNTTPTPSFSLQHSSRRRVRKSTNVTRELSA